MQIEPQQLKAFLAGSGMIDEKEFDKIVKRAEKERKEVGELLVEEGLVSKEQLIKLKAYVLGIPFVNLASETIDPEVLKIIPRPIAVENNIVAFRKQGKNLEVAMLDPGDLRTIDFIKKASDLKIRPRLTTEEGIKYALRQYEETLEAEFSQLIKNNAEALKIINSDDQQEDDEANFLSKKAEELPVIRIVDSLLKHAILQRASDIHIEPTEKEVIVRYRIDGVLRDAMVLPKQVAPALVARIKVLSNLRLDEHRLPQDGRFKIESEAYKYSARVSVLPIIDGEKVVMRLLSETADAFSLSQLGLYGVSSERAEQALRRPVGMILVTGPTGCGKTTTLYSMVEILNSLRVNISTIEDPVEYRMSRVNQMQVKPGIGLSFASGLRSLLRQDPDIIMVGEIRDNETASLAVNAALTGHLVFSTLHTNDAAGAIPRLIDMGVEPFLISSTLNVIIAQRLVRRLCDNKEKYFLTRAQVKEIGQYCDLKRVIQIVKKRKVIEKDCLLDKIPFYKAVQDKEYSEGYKGRMGIFEVLFVTETIKEMIVANATASAIEKQAKKEGMVTMVEDGIAKAAQGITSIEEVLRVIIE